MPERVSGLLQEALKSAPTPVPTPAGWEQYARTCQERLSQLAKVPWVDLSKFQRVEFVRAGQSERAGGRVKAGWKWDRDADELVWLNSFGAEYGERRVGTTLLRTNRLAEELPRVFADLERIHRNEQPQYYLREALPQSGREFFILAWGAAWDGLTNETIRLLHTAWLTNDLADGVDQILLGEARRMFNSGLDALKKGAPRSRVLAAWDELLAHFRGRVTPELVDVIATLHQQVADFPRLAATTVEDPGTLPPTARARYYIERFPDMVVSSRPGQSGNNYEALVRAMGTNAIPALLEALTNRWVVRTTVERSNLSEAPLDRVDVYVRILRVQDLALASLEAMTRTRFHQAPPAEPAFSGQPADVRARIAAEVAAWWQTYTNQGPVTARLARLTDLPLFERIPELLRLERLDSNAVQVVPLLKTWAQKSTGAELGPLFDALVKRGDLSLLPAIRASWNERFPRHLEFLPAHGTAEDFRQVRERAVAALRSESPDERGHAQHTLGALFGLDFRRTQPITNRLAVPLLVDLLEVREESSTRWVGNQSVRCSLADLAMTSLEAIVSHPTNYSPTNTLPARLEAIDRWLSWWNSDGEKNFWAQHPEVRPVFGEDWGREVDPGRDIPPGLVSVAGPDPAWSVRYRIAHDDLQRLWLEKAIVARRAHGRWHFRFANDKAARQWFLSARASDRPAAGNTAVEKIETTAMHGLGVAANGQAWMGAAGDFPGEAELKQRVEAAAHAPSNRPAVITGARLLRVDGLNRIWISPLASPGTLLGYDSERRDWVKHEARGLPAGLRTSTEAGFLPGNWQSRAGRLYFCDGEGVHVFRDGKWEYQAMVQTGLPANTAAALARTPRGFAEDADGRVYCWIRSTPAGGGPIAPWGCWFHDGQGWTNDLRVPFIVDLVARPGGEYWAIGTNDAFFVVQSSGVRTSVEAVRHALGTPEARRVRVLPATPGATVLLSADEPAPGAADARTPAIFLVPERGDARRQPPEFARAITTHRSFHPIVVMTNGVVWLRDAEHRLQAWDDRGRPVQHLPPLESMPPSEIIHGDHQGHLYLRVIGHEGSIYKLRPKDPRLAEAVSRRFPSMLVNDLSPVFNDSLGRPWCHSRSFPERLAVFSDGGWNHRQRTMTNADRSEWGTGLAAAFPGPDGAMLLTDRKGWAGLVVGQQFLQNESVAQMLNSHPEELRRSLTTTTEGDLDRRDLSVRYEHLHKDSAGRLWWWSSKEFVVITEAGAIAVDLPALGCFTNNIASIDFLAPVGRGSSVLATTTLGESAILDVEAGRVVARTRLGADAFIRTNRGSFTRYRLDRQGRLWLSARGSVGSAAIDASGSIVATNAGSILAEDRRGGLWFHQVKADADQLARVGSDGRVATLTLRRMISNLAEAHDDTFWIATANEWQRLRADGSGLAVVETAIHEEWSSVQLWIDQAGRLWSSAGSPRSSGGPSRLECLFTKEQTNP